MVTYVQSTSVFYDIIAFQETKCPTGKIPKRSMLSNYEHYFLENQRNGQHGVSIYSRKKPIKILYGLNNEECDKEARAITAEYDKFFLINVYAPYAGQNLEKLTKKLTWSKAFINFTKKLDTIKPLIICGDLNVAHTRLDVANPQTRMWEAGFTIEDRIDMTSLLGNKLIDIFRFLYPTKRTYTFWQNADAQRRAFNGWRLDYFLTSKRLAHKILDIKIDTNIFGSDHAPVLLFGIF